MDDERVQRIESALDDLVRRVESLEQELVSQGFRIGPWSGDEERTLPVVDTVAPTPQGVLPLVGRIFLVLGGAFLFRAATDAGLLPQAIGAGAGFLYGLTWIGMAWRAASSSRLSAHFHAIASAMIVFPLLWEATVKFGFLPPPASAVNLAAATGLAMIVAWRRNLPGVAWLFAGSGTPVAVLLAASTKLWLPFLGIALLLCWGSLLLAYQRRWYFLGAIGSAFGDQVVLLLTGLYLLQPGKPPLEELSASTLIVLQMTLLLLYLGTFVARTLWRGHEIHVAEVVQAAAVSVLGLGGSWWVARDEPAFVSALGLVVLVASVASYAVSFSFIDRDKDHRRNFVFYTSTALTFTLIAAALLWEGSTQGWLLIAAAVFTAAIAVWKQRATLLLHAAVFVTAAAVSSGLLETTMAVLRIQPASLSTGSVPLYLAVLVVFLSCATVRITTHYGTWGRFERAPRAWCLAWFLLGMAGILVATANRWLTDGATGEVDAGVVAAVRTSLLSVFAVLLAWLSHRPRYSEAGWILYPMLVLAGIELVVGDLRVGRPATLFVSLAMYGGALILAPRLSRRRRPAPTNVGAA